MRTVGEILTLSATWLGDRGVASPRLDAELLVAHVLGVTRLQVYLQHDRPLEEPELRRVRELLARRGRREPVATILGHKEFHGLDFEVRPGLLVPRPDTETLVEAVLARIPEDREAPLQVVDVGSGTGCVGLTLAARRPCIRLRAVDRSPLAVACTSANAERLGVAGRVVVRQGDLLAQEPGDPPPDLLVSNPPYVPTAEWETLAPEVRQHEPRLALDGGPDGLDVIRRLLSQVAPVRWGVALEVAYDQADRVESLLRDAGFPDTARHRDLAGHARVVTGFRSAG